VYPEQPNRLEQTAVGDFLWDFLHPRKAGEDEKKEKLRFYEDVIAHANDSQTLENILETVKCPSIPSLRRLKYWPVQMGEWKAKHFQAVWKRNQFDTDPIVFFYEMGSDFFNYVSGSRNMYEEFITKLLHRLLANSDSRIEEFFDEIALSRRKEMIKPLLYILYHKLAFLWAIKKSEKGGSEIEAEQEGIRRIIKTIRKCYDHNHDIYHKMMKEMIHRRFMEFTIEPLAATDKALLQENKRIYEKYFDKKKDSLINIRLEIMERYLKARRFS